MILAFRTKFYDDVTVATQQLAAPAFDWFAVLRAQSINCPYARRPYRTYREKTMVDPSENEIEAMLSAGTVGGEYLDSIGKTDLGALGEDEYMTFIETVISGYQDKLAVLHGEIPM